MSTETQSSALEPLANKLSYRAELDAEDRAAVLALPHTVRRMERAHFIVRERELATHSCVMLSGYSIRSKLAATGARQIVAIHMKGECVDLQNRPRSATGPKELFLWRHLRSSIVGAAGGETCGRREKRPYAA